MVKSPDVPRVSYPQRLWKNIAQYYELYLLILPVVVYYLIFSYYPMYGAQIAFRTFLPRLGIWGSPWVGLKNFITYFQSYYFLRLITNTLMISIYDVLFAFPAPILLALLLNELHGRRYKRLVQTMTYLPHFVSLVVICGLVRDMLSKTGLFNTIMGYFGVPPRTFLLEPGSFRAIYVISGIWQNVGWGSIIYLSAISGIDMELYEAATIDGAGRFRQVISITIPSILSTIIILLILRLGQMMNVGSEKILLLYNEATYDTADVISTFVYRKGLLQMDYSYATAVGLVNSAVNFVLLLSANAISKRLTQTALF